MRKLTWMMRPGGDGYETVVHYCGRCWRVLVWTGVDLPEWARDEGMSDDLWRVLVVGTDKCQWVWCVAKPADVDTVVWREVRRLTTCGLR